MADKYVKLNDIIDTLEHEWGYESMREDLQNLPSADVEEIVHGEWKVTVLEASEKVFRTGGPHCNICGKMAPQRYSYCPHCGAKMDGKKGAE